MPTNSAGAMASLPRTANIRAYSSLRFASLLRKGTTLSGAGGEGSGGGGTGLTASGNTVGA
jgi:hypothetical protein